LGPVEELQGEVKRLISISVADNTNRTYQAGWNKFSQFCDEYRLASSIPISVGIICSFIAFLSVKGFAWATVTTYMAAISFKHKIRGVGDPTNCFIIKKLMEGFRRDRGTQLDCRLPITINHLKKLLGVLPTICSSEFEALLFRAVFLVMFFGFLRLGEVAASSKNVLQKSLLKRSDISFKRVQGSDVAVVRFSFSKNNQVGFCQQIVLRAHQESFMCPISALNDYLLQSSGSVLFTHFDKSPLTKFQFKQVLKKAVDFCSFPEKDLFKSHSFRIGAATTAKEMGFSDEEIQTMGRWRSAVFKNYIRLPPMWE
jgi:hypothetical protein